MKIQISYIKDEEKSAAAVVAALRSVLPDVSVKHSENHPPRKHIYATLPEIKRNS